MASSCSENGVLAFRCRYLLLPKKHVHYTGLTFDFSCSEVRLLANGILASVNYETSLRNWDSISTRPGWSFLPTPIFPCYWAVPVKSSVGAYGDNLHEYGCYWVQKWGFWLLHLLHGLPNLISLATVVLEHSKRAFDEQTVPELVGFSCLR